jgi:hypothetical protein
LERGKGVRSEGGQGVRSPVLDARVEWIWDPFSGGSRPFGAFAPGYQLTTPAASASVVKNRHTFGMAPAKGQHR